MRRAAVPEDRLVDAAFGSGERRLGLDDGDPIEDVDDIDTGLPMPPTKLPAGSVLQEVGEGDVIDEESQELDAFIDGKNRPSHLDSATLEYPDDDESWRPAKPCFARARMLK